jgi:glycogen debranching enzyme
VLERSWIAGAGQIVLLAGATVCLTPSGTPCRGQTSATDLQQQAALAFDTEGGMSRHFIAVHGRRALIDGYAMSGLEVWAYPFQILSGYRVAFHEPGTTTPINGQDILSRVIYEPEGVTRIYLGPDFIVRERLFVPLNQPGAILTYKVESRHPVEIEVHATPVLDLMWPGALGGQSTAWSPPLSAFVVTEPTDGYSAVVGSPEIVAHDEMDNRTVGEASSASLGFKLQPDHAGTAQVYVALNPPHADDQGALFRQLIRDRMALEAESAAHVQKLLQSVLKIETPEPNVNQAIAWAEIALDQAWVCNPDLGCGFVAGYGPSRGARRPQYDWFFAGDGLVATEASIATGDYARAREELEFIIRYQDQKTGMIWHELSQSAALIDWAGKFPYMFVHVDITFQFLSTVERYVTASGDASFVRKYWKSIESADGYCRSLIDPASGLPRIPADKEGGDEQDRIADDLGLSTSWVQAASAFAHVAALAGQPAMADQATESSHLAAAAIPARYWNEEQNFWVSGHTPTGKDAPERRSGPAETLSLQLFNPEQNAALLDELASSSFQTDWGTRGVGSGSDGYDPGSYAKGSVWAVSTSSLAEAFWAQHRPVIAAELWRALLPWTWLDSPGHMHEVLAGDVYRAQGESVPEQTWSSAGFLDATVHGLLGLDVDALANRITFTPRLVPAWRSVSVHNIHLSNALVSLAFDRTPQGLTLSIDNAGPPCSFIFSPELPLGAHLGAASLGDQPIAVELESNPQETDAHVALTAAHGKSELHIEVQGGVAVIAESPQPKLADASAGVRVIRTNLAGNVLTLEADVRSDRESRIQLQTVWGIANVEGADLTPTGNGIVGLAFPANRDKSSPGSYRRARVTVQFKP